MYFRNLSRFGWNRHVNERYIVSCIFETVLYGSRLLHTRTTRNYVNRAIAVPKQDGSTLSLFDKLMCNNSTTSAYAAKNRANDLDSCGVCLITVNDSIQIGIRAFVDVFSLDTSGIFSSTVKIFK